MKKIGLLFTLILSIGTTFHLIAMQNDDTSSSSDSSPEKDLQDPNKITESKKKLSPLLENIDIENKINIRQCLNAMAQLNKEINRLLKTASKEEKIKKLEKINNKMEPMIFQLTQTTNVFLNIAAHDSFFDAYREQLNELAEKNHELINQPNDKNYVSISNEITTIGTITNNLLNNPDIAKHLKTKTRWSCLDKALTICYVSCLTCLVCTIAIVLPKFVDAFVLEAAADWAREGTKLLSGTTEWLHRTAEILEYIKKFNE